LLFFLHLAVFIATFKSLNPAAKMRTPWPILLCALIIPLFAQSQAPTASCGQQEITQKLFNANPAIKQFQQQIETILGAHNRRILNGEIQRQQPTEIVTLPVVVHIIHNNGPENISDARVFTAIQHLNEAFANTGYYDPADGVNTQIQFCLAQRDPGNNPTNGIDRVVSPLTVMNGWNNSTEDLALKNLSRWDPRCYINIWLVREISGPVAGYAYLPSAHGMNIDGIVGEAGYFGSSNANDVLIIHEMGHYLGLYHTFQGACKNDDCTKDGDQVCDTPPDQSTAGIACNNSVNSCSTDALSGFSTDVNDLHTDYLDYGNWNCMKVFTQGQADRMNWMIQNVRKSLLQCKSCLPACPSPVSASFSSSASTVTAGTTVNFTNSTVNASGSRWYINNLLQSTMANYSYNFTIPGRYIVQLTALTSNPLCDSAIALDTIDVQCGVNAAFAPGSQTVPLITALTFTNASTGASSYQWRVNGTVQSGAANYTHVFNAAGLFNIQMIASDSYCRDTAEVMISAIDTTVITNDSCQDFIFQKRIGTLRDDHAYDFKYYDQVYYIAGTTTGQRGDRDGLLVSLDIKGNIFWSKTWATAAEDRIQRVVKLNDNFLLFAGTTAATPEAPAKLVLIKTFNSGDISAKAAITLPFAVDELSGITATADGGFAVCGIANTVSGTMAFVAKGRANASIEWISTYMSVDKLVGIVQVGNALAIASYTDVDLTTHVSHLVRLNVADGTVLSAARYHTEFTDMAVNSGNIIITGRLGLPHLLPAHQFKLELAPDGTFRNAWKLLNSDSTYEKNYRISPNGAVLLQQPRSANTSVTIFDNNWNRKINTSHSPVFDRVSVVDYRGIAAVGTTELTADRGTDIYVLKTVSRIESSNCVQAPLVNAMLPVSFLIENIVVDRAPVSLVSSADQTPLLNHLINTETICADTVACVPPVQDSCARSTFQKTYTHAQHSLEVQSIEPARDGGTIAGGRISYRTIPQVNPLVIKLNSNGDVQWAKDINGLYYGELSKVRQTRDGGFIAVGKATTTDFRGWIFVMKLSAGGATLWTKYFSLNGNSEEGNDIIELDNGNLAITASTNFQMGGNGLLIVTNGLGALQWAKLFRANDGTALYSAIEVGDTLVVAGHNRIAATNSFTGAIIKLNKSSGIVYQSVGFRTASNNNLMPKIFKTNYGYFITSFTNQLGGFTDRQLGMLQLNDNLGIINDYRFNRVEPSFFAYAVPTGDSGMLASQSSTSGVLLFSSRTGSSFNSRWKKSYGTLLSDHQATNPLLLPDGYVMTASAYIAAAERQKRGLLLVKGDRGGNTQDCPTENPGDAIESTTATTMPITWANTPSFSSIDPPPDWLTNNNLIVETTTLCSACDSIAPPPVDTCGTNTFQKKLGGSGDDRAFDIKVLPDNNYLLAGSTASLSGPLANEDALLVKLNDKGNILWQKTMNGAQADRFTKIVLHSSGEYVVFGNTRSRSNANGSMLLAKFDAAGNTTFSREYNFQNASHTGFLHVAAAIELPGGDIAFAGNAAGINTDVGQPLQTVYNIIGVLGIDGSIKWVRRIREYYTESGGGILGMVHDNGSLFITATYGIMKLSAADGSTNTLNKKYQTYGSFNSIEKQGSAFVALSASHRVIFNNNLEIVSAQRLQASPGYSMQMQGFASEGGEMVQGVHFNSITNKEGKLAIADINGNGWSHNYPFPADEMRSFSGSRRGNDQSIFLFGSMHKIISDVQNGPSDILLVKTDSLGRITDCPRGDFNISFIPQQDNFLELHARYYPISTQVFTQPVQTTNSSLSVEGLCPGKSCNLLQLSARDTVCDLSDTLVVRAKRSAGCDAFTEWIVDTTSTRILLANDSMLLVQFKRAGTFTIHANITSGCELISDSISAEIFDAPDSLNLGPDIQLCKISTYTLNARSGFKSYIWQDGSVDSVLTVYNPGVYHVTALDYCGNAYRDTVIITQAPDIPFDLGADRQVCLGDSITIAAPGGFTNYLWSPGHNVTNTYAQTIRVWPSADTTYTVIAEKSIGCLVTDSIRVYVNRPTPVFVGSDTALCANDSLIVAATPGFTAYLWNTGATSASIIASARAYYSVRATNAAGCISTDTMQVTDVFPLPLVDLGDDFSVCRGDLKVFDAGDFQSYSWQDGTSERRLSASIPGLYWVKVTNSNGCSASDSLTIISYLPKPAGFLDSTAEICIGGNIELKGAPGYDLYRWFNNAASTTVRITSPGNYWLEVTNADGCTTRDTIIVKSKDCLKGIFFPNAFTPGNGGGNNVFRPIVHGQLENFQLVIFNRWGQKVFETRDANRGWDGFINGQPQGTGTFTFTAVYKFTGAGEKQETARGTVTLIR
jgi:gliding motility-associated-like protein